MLKLIESYSEALDYARYLMGHVDLKDYRVGVCGSFIDGSNKKSSAVDIVLARKRDENGKVLNPDTPVGLRSVVAELENQSGLVYYTRPRVLWYDLLEEENKKLSSGIDAEYPTPFKTMQDSLRWLDEVPEATATEADVEGSDCAEEDDIPEPEVVTPPVHKDESSEVDSDSMFEQLNPEEKKVLNSVGGGEVDA